MKAAKIKGAAHPRVIDATAGLGEDSLLLAAAGFSVTLFENDPVIATLLSDALRRAEEVPELSEAVSRMRFIEGDSITAMRRMTEGMFHSGSYDCFKANEGRNETAPPVLPEVILLDPMFPEREKSALVKKKFQLLQKLERPCDDEEADISTDFSVIKCTNISSMICDTMTKKSSRLQANNAVQPGVHCNLYFFFFTG